MRVMLRGREKTIYERVIRSSINNGTLSKSRDEIFIRGEGCNTSGVWLHQHEHHSFMHELIMCEACLETLQHMLIFHVCL
jgi:hypothetical protein